MPACASGRTMSGHQGFCCVLHVVSVPLHAPASRQNIHNQFHMSVHACAGFDNVTIVGGILPSEWGSLTRLQSLSLSFSASARQSATPVSLPASWSSITSLQRLDLTNWAITGSPPLTWSSLYNLRELSLRNVSFCCGTGITLPPSWSGMGNLTRLVLEDVRGLSGSLPQTWVTGFTNLTALQLRGLPGLVVTAADMAGLLNASRASGGLQSLALEGFNLTGPLPSVTSRCVGPGFMMLPACQTPTPIKAHSQQGSAALTTVVVGETASSSPPCFTSV